MLSTKSSFQERLIELCNTSTNLTKALDRTFKLSDIDYDTSTSQLGQATESDREWTRMSEQYTNAGYREGITAGKESALQLSFDQGFADTGAPIGRQLGVLRGSINGILSYLESKHYLESDSGEREKLVDETINISEQLSKLHFLTLVPPDEEALEHAREHGDVRDSGEEVEKTRKAMSDLIHARQRLVNILERLDLRDLI